MRSLGSSVWPLEVLLDLKPSHSRGGHPKSPREGARLHLPILPTSPLRDVSASSQGHTALLDIGRLLVTAPRPASTHISRPLLVCQRAACHWDLLPPLLVSKPPCQEGTQRATHQVDLTHPAVAASS